jgi:hypothetical protein
VLHYPEVVLIRLQRVPDEPHQQDTPDVAGWDYFGDRAKELRRVPKQFESLGARDFVALDLRRKNRFAMAAVCAICHSL